MPCEVPGCTLEAAGPVRYAIPSKDAPRLCPQHALEHIAEREAAGDRVRVYEMPRPPPRSAAELEAEREAALRRALEVAEVRHAAERKKREMESIETDRMERLKQSLRRMTRLERRKFVEIVYDQREQCEKELLNASMLFSSLCESQRNEPTLFDGGHVSRLAHALHSARLRLESAGQRFAESDIAGVDAMSAAMEVDRQLWQKDIEADSSDPESKD